MSSIYFSGTKDFEIAPRFSENFFTPGYVGCDPTVCG